MGAKVFQTRPFYRQTGVLSWWSSKGTRTPRLDQSKSFGKIRSQTRCILYQVMMISSNLYQRYNLQNLQNLHATCKNLQNLQDLLQVVNLLNINIINPKLAKLAKLASVFEKLYMHMRTYTHVYARENYYFFCKFCKFYF